MEYDGEVGHTVDVSTGVVGGTEMEIGGPETECPLTLDGKSLGESDLKLLLGYTLKVEDHLSDRTFSRLAKAFPNSSQDSLKMVKKRV
jgi:hypothetical protein